ncbi:ATP-binding protein [Archaeoglobus veneficus]|uniref:Cobyrinic acid ac-diamide synthase n=1 Tax=Archaeoglobus veneficus (strain DSM 11195 / SNP6) TaxID=693661 RepID=F2KPS8_ARCVS|nr:ATP-binding protein [Archaeoglobus veneficus]AEA47606.1 Cobyrinic acid ac-diamide synthase [Archaeoglobus veneficus SNP6]
MKQITVISGKGGTGKTTITATFAYLAGNSVIADCDVDAPNLHILLKPRIMREEPFMGGRKAFITSDCNACGLCYELCRFDAIVPGDIYSVDETRCEGCALCFNACPSKAVEMRVAQSGKIFISETDYGPMVHALLNPGEENSGKLVSEVREKAKLIAEEKKAKLLLLDGAPGIGCPVIASLANTDIAVVVAEPTLSGISDMGRVLDLAEHFRVESVVIINKHDLNPDVVKEIEKLCATKGVEVLGKIPYDASIPEQLSKLSFPFEGEAAKAIADVWECLM